MGVGARSVGPASGLVPSGCPYKVTKSLSRLNIPIHSQPVIDSYLRLVEAFCPLQRINHQSGFLCRFQQILLTPQLEHHPGVIAGWIGVAYDKLGRDAKLF